MAKKAKPSLPFAKRLVLNRYILSLFGVENFEDLSIYVNKMENEGWTEDRISKFHYPTPAKHASSLASPYTDLFREFQRQIVREQSVLFVLGYSFSDAHINNIIYQALTIPTFRVVIFADPENLPSNELKKLKNLKDSRIWIIGGQDAQGLAAHYFGYFVEHFMPQQPSDDVDRAVKNVMTKLIGGDTNDHG